MREQYIYEVVEDFHQSQRGDYYLVRYKFPENDDFQVLVKISNPRKMGWERSCANIDWGKCLCYIAITEGLEKQKSEVFLRGDVKPQNCPWPNIKNNFCDNVCFIDSPDPPFGFHSRKKE
jgi:hypothetical protein